MQIFVILGFALVLAAEHVGSQSRFDSVRTFSVFDLAPAYSISIVVGIAAVTVTACAWGSRRTIWRLKSPNASISRVGRRHGRLQMLVHAAIVAGFAADLYLFGWTGTVRTHWGLGNVPLLDDVILLLPFFVTVAACWWVGYGADRELRTWSVDEGEVSSSRKDPWVNRRRYLIYHLRHSLVFWAIPMFLIILLNDLEQKYQREIHALTGQVWVGQLAVGCGAALIFLIMPWMMRYIWETRPLPEGELRGKLSAIARSAGVSYRQILIWESGGAIVSAAVTGLLRPVRYILLSDGLLETMDDAKVEAVFGHELAHVKKRHIYYYLVFMFCAFVGAFAVGNLVRMQFGGQNAWGQRAEILVLAATWAIVFGFISRRFERQADVFGARCLGDRLDCSEDSCNLHTENRPSDAICFTAAEIFADALENVAVLNGISPQTRSWRHSSIASRSAFIRRLADKPADLATFESSILWIKAALIAGAIVSVGYSAYAYRRVLPWNWVGIDWS
jgi:STE24 endopeptidase